MFEELKTEHFLNRKNFKSTEKAQGIVGRIKKKGHI